MHDTLTALLDSAADVPSYLESAIFSSRPAVVGKLEFPEVVLINLESQAAVTYRACVAATRDPYAAKGSHPALRSLLEVLGHTMWIVYRKNSNSKCMAIAWQLKAWNQELHSMREVNRRVDNQVAEANLQTAIREVRDHSVSEGCGSVNAPSYGSIQSILNELSGVLPVGWQEWKFSTGVSHATTIRHIAEQDDRGRIQIGAPATIDERLALMEQALIAFALIGSAVLFHFLPSKMSDWEGMIKTVQSDALKLHSKSDSSI